MRLRLSLFLFIFSISVTPAYSQLVNYEEIVEKSNRIMKSIYSELWRIRNNYDELKGFGPENYSTTPELPIQYQNIKSIRIRSTTDNDRATVFRSEHFRGEKDILYICFSDKNKAFGTLTIPFCGVYIKELGLYILAYINVDDKYFERDIKNILIRNAVVVEQTSY